MLRRRIINWVKTDSQAFAKVTEPLNACVEVLGVVRRTSPRTGAPMTRGLIAPCRRIRAITMCTSPPTSCIRVGEPSNVVDGSPFQVQFPLT
jgi:hypothetical protein